MTLLITQYLVHLKKNLRMKICRYAGIQVCKYANMRESKNESKYACLEILYCLMYIQGRLQVYKEVLQ